jgi:hypothetical protein
MPREIGQNTPKRIRIKQTFQHQKDTNKEDDAREQTYWCAIGKIGGRVSHLHSLTVIKGKITSML